jgi:hypothetical protein
MRVVSKPASRPSSLNRGRNVGRRPTLTVVSAHMWLNLAATSRATDSAAHDQAAKERDMLATKMTPAQIAKAQRLASDWPK